MKGSGGASGLTEDPIVFSCRLPSGTELGRLVKQLENEYFLDADLDLPSNFHNHGQAGPESFRYYQTNGKYFLR